MVEATCVVGGAGGIVWMLHAASAWVASQAHGHVWTVKAAVVLLWLVSRGLEAVGGAGIVLFVARGRIEREISSAVGSACAGLFSGASRQRLGLVEALVQACLQLCLAVLLLAVVVPAAAAAVLGGWVAFAAALASLAAVAAAAAPISNAALAKARYLLQVVLQVAGATWLIILFLWSASNRTGTPQVL